MKILVRCGMLPFENFSEEDVLKYDSIGTNSGNLLFQYSVIKALMTVENEIFSDRYKIDIDNATFINENYDCYVLPMADAFRNDFRENLRNYTKLIKKLSIPVYVIGIGLRANFDAEELTFEFDNEVRDFVNAVIEKSTCIGLRGAITGQYLTKLGFKEGQDFIVIGCPSMYSFGENLDVQSPNFDINSIIAINGNRVTSDEAWDKIYSLSENFSEGYFIPQEYDELFLTYAGGPNVETNTNNFPSNYKSPFYKQGNVRFFINALEWFRFLGKVDYSIGTRLHGNIAATVSGTPNLTIAIDSRMKELAEFHGLPYVSEKEFLEIENLKEYISEIDYSKIGVIHKNNFNNFKDFLRKNNLKSIYDIEESNNLLLDKKIDYVTSSKIIKPISAVDFDVLVKRIEYSTNFRKNKFEVSKENWRIYKGMLHLGIFK